MSKESIDIKGKITKSLNRPVNFRSLILILSFIGSLISCSETNDIRIVRLASRLDSELFIEVGIAKTSIEKVVKPLLTMFVAMIIALFLVTYFPELSLWLPRQFGL